MEDIAGAFVVNLAKQPYGDYRCSHSIKGFPSDVLSYVSDKVFFALEYLVGFVAEVVNSLHDHAKSGLLNVLK